MTRWSLAAMALTLAACGPVEVRLDETKGIPAVKGKAEVTLGAFTCGEPIATGDKTVATRVVAGGCEFTFDDTIEVLRAQDYQAIPELKGATNLVQRVEVTLKALRFSDASTDTTLDAATRVTSVVLSVNGQAVADKAALAALPRVVRLEGDALTALKAKVDARQPASVATRAVVVLPDTPAPPPKLGVEYDAQPAIVLGPGEIKLF